MPDPNPLQRGIIQKKDSVFDFIYPSINRFNLGIFLLLIKYFLYGSRVNIT